MCTSRTDRCDPRYAGTKFTNREYAVSSACCPRCAWWYTPTINTLTPRHNGCHFPDDIFKWIFLNGNVWITIKGPIDNIPALVQIKAWRRPGDKPLSEAMMVTYWRIYASLYNDINPFYRILPLHIAPICQKIIHIGVATPEVTTFGAETHSSHPRPWPHSGIFVSSSSDDL